MKSTYLTVEAAGPVATITLTQPDVRNAFSDEVIADITKAFQTVGAIDTVRAVVLAAQTELAQVQQLVEKGQWDQAQEKLAALSSTVQSVGPVEQKQDLIQQWNALTYKVVEVQAAD